jgi:uncharacterized protein (TIGR04255 family)
MTSQLTKPLGGPPPVEVPLARAPLEKVIAQVQFPPTFSIGAEATIAGFQNLLREQYPLALKETEQAFRIEHSPMGQFMNPITRPAYKFSDTGKNWTVSLTSESISLDVNAYSSRHDFLERWSKILQAVEDQFSPPLVLRTGMRYVDRIKAPQFNRVRDLIKEEYLGPLFSRFDNQVLHMISETALKAEEGNLLIRLGKMPSGGTVDPNVLQPIEGESFVVDLDVSNSDQRRFVHSELSTVFTAFAERAYSVFRDIVANDFLSTYGS